MANGYGGARKGAGRPKGSPRIFNTAMKQAEGRAILNIAQQAQAYLENRLLKNLNNLGALADGIQVKEGDTPVYSVPPDRQSNVYLLDRYLGKPTERVEGRGEVTIKIVYEKRPRVVDGQVHKEKT